MLRILHIEDSRSDQVLVQKTLEGVFGEGVTIDVAGSLADARQKLISPGGYHVILLDLILPDAQGTATVQRVKELAGNTPIVVLTGLEQTEVDAQALAFGARGILVKSDLSGNQSLLVSQVLDAVRESRSREDWQSQFNSRLDALAAQFTNVTALQQSIARCQHALFGNGEPGLLDRIRDGERWRQRANTLLWAVLSAMAATTSGVLVSKLFRS